MQVSPRYGRKPVIVLEVEPGSILGPAVRQRRRLAETLGGFDPEQWAHPSRCAGWSARDVVAHLDGTNEFWTASIEAGVRGEPTRYLAAFDPVTTPAAMVDGRRSASPAEVLAGFTASTERLTALLESLHDTDWTRPAEAPPGHISVSAVAHHALWDAWIHEHDILAPMGATVPSEPDEVEACLRYVAALGPALAINNGRTDTGVLTIDVTDPDVALTAEVGDHVTVRPGTAQAATLRLDGDAVALVDALSVRRQLDHPVPGEAAWMLQGLVEIFDAAPTA